MKIKNYNEILESLQLRARQEFGNDINLHEHSPLGKILQTNAYLISLMYEDVEHGYYQSHLLTATDEGLDLLGANMETPRKQGTKASGDIIITAKKNTFLKQGTLFRSDNGLLYELAYNTLFEEDGEKTVLIIASKEGSKYNTIENTITQLSSPILGVSKITNLAITGGTDNETDDDYRERLLFKRRTPLTGDNPAQYIVWARDVDGVGKCGVLRATPTEGYVTVIITDGNGDVANESIINDVQTKIEGVKPVNAGVIVESAIKKNVNIVGDINIRSGLDKETVSSNIHKNIQKYLYSISLEESFISYSQIIQVILTTDGVIGFDELLVNNNNINIQLKKRETPVLNTFDITLNEVI